MQPENTRIGYSFKCPTALIGIFSTLFLDVQKSLIGSTDIESFRRVAAKLVNVTESCFSTAPALWLGVLYVD